MSTVTVDAPLDLRAAWRSVRLPVILVAVVVGVAVLAGVLSSSPPRRPLDPRDAAPQGALALSRQIERQGVVVTPVADAAAARPAADTTVLVVDPASMTTDALRSLAAAGGSAVVLAPQERELAALGVAATPAGGADDTLSPACALPAAEVAGDVRYSGLLYADARDEGCYRAGGSAGLFVSHHGAGEVAVFGSPSTFSNEHLAARGDAALALGLLTQRPRLLWLLPQPATSRPADVGSQGLLDLLPSRLLWAVLQLLVAVVVLALWRARRLGPVVAEPLPVVVRSVETVEGRARLLRAARARGTAAATLREATRARLRDLLALGADAQRAAVVAAVAARIERSATEVEGVLYGADPMDDAGLVALANHLTRLEQDVRIS